jgi:hypothetical protein
MILTCTISSSEIQKSQGILTSMKRKVATQHAAHGDAISESLSMSSEYGRPLKLKIVMKIAPPFYIPANRCSRLPSRVYALT